MSPALSAVRALEREAPPVLDLIRERVLLRVRRRLAWLYSLESACAGDPLVQALLDDPAAEADFHAANGELAELARRLVVVESALQDGLDDRAHMSPLRLVAHEFALSVYELDLLQAGVALELAPALASAYQRLTGVPGVSEELVRRLFAHPTRPLLRSDGALLRWRLAIGVDAGLGAPPLLQVDPQVTAWLSGQAPLHASLQGAARPARVHAPLASWPISATAAAIAGHFEASTPVRLVVTGVPGSGRRSFVAAVLHALGTSGLRIDAAALGEGAWPECSLLVARQSRLSGVVPILELLPARPTAELAAQLELSALVCGPLERPTPVEGVIDLRVDLGVPGFDERVALWRGLVPASTRWAGASVQALAGRHALPVGDLAAIGLRRPASAEAADELCREYARHRLGELGSVLRCPFRMADLVVPTKIHDHLAEFIFEARDRVDFWERPEARRLYPRGTGLVALFTGTAGTGKTMAAQVLAAELGLDLVRIDLASIVSKYIGETAKNMRRVFGAAAGMSAVFLFDEADALFARRTDVRDSHDRHANADTNYLLQLLEDFAGVAVLASNKKANIDPAFTRRIRHVLDFVRPDAPARRQIWQQILDELGADISAAPLDALAALDLSGAEIKNAVLGATFIARSENRPLGLQQLLRGLEREFDKDGRGLDRRERERLAAHV